MSKQLPKTTGRIEIDFKRKPYVVHFLTPKKPFQRVKFTDRMDIEKDLMELVPPHKFNSWG